MTRPVIPVPGVFEDLRAVISENRIGEEPKPEQVERAVASVLNAWGILTLCDNIKATSNGDGSFNITYKLRTNGVVVPPMELSCE